MKVDCVVFLIRISIRNFFYFYPESFISNYSSHCSLSVGSNLEESSFEKKERSLEVLNFRTLNYHTKSGLNVLKQLEF